MCIAGVRERCSYLSALRRILPHVAAPPAVHHFDVRHNNIDVRVAENELHNGKSWEDDL